MCRSSIPASLPVAARFALTWKHHLKNYAFCVSCRNLKYSPLDGVNNMEHILEKLSPLNTEFQPPIYQDVHGLQQLIRGLIESLQMKLSPYTDEMRHKISENLINLRLQLIPITEELMDQVLLQIRVLEQRVNSSLHMKVELLERRDKVRKVRKFAAYYAEKIALQIDQVKEMFHPYAERLVNEIHLKLEELHEKVATHAATTLESTSISQCIQDLSVKLTQNAQDLHQRIHNNLDHLKQQLSLYSSILSEKYSLSNHENPQEVAGRDREDLALQVKERIEEFRRDTLLQIENFSRTVDREMDDMKPKLPSPPLQVEEFQHNSMTARDLHVRLGSLFKVLSEGLNNPSGSLH